MGLIGSVLGGVFGGVASIFGASSASSQYNQNMRDYSEQRNMLQGRVMESDNYARKEMYTPAGQTADAMAAKTAAREVMEDAQKRANQNVTTGATAAEKQMMKDKAMETLGQMETRAAINQENRRNQVHAQNAAEVQGYLNGDSQMLNYIGAARNAKANAIMGATQQMAGSLSSLGRALPI